MPRGSRSEPRPGLAATRRARAARERDGHRSSVAEGTGVTRRLGGTVNPGDRQRKRLLVSQSLCCELSALLGSRWGRGSAALQRCL